MASSLPATDDRSSEGGPRPELTWVARAALLLVVVLLVGVFVTAALLNPYDANNEPRRWETHTQLGLPECSFKTMTNQPCPSCGMTTSFSLLMHGDAVNSLRVNFAGTLLAVFLLLSIPWALAAVVRRRLLFIASLEYALTWVVAFFLALLLVRWAFVLM